MTHPFKFPPFPHQAREFEASKDLDARALLWQMRTGKTKLAIDTACYRHSRGDIGGLLVLAPNGVHLNWTRREIPAHAWDSSHVVAHAWQTQESGKTAHDASLERCLSHRDGLAVLAVNSEALISPKTQKAIKAFLRRRKVMLVVDESHAFRTPSSRRSKLARGLARKCVVRRILTGTPVSNSPLAAWSQFELLEPGCLGYTRFSDFRSRHAIFVQARNASGQFYEMLDRYANLDELQERLARVSSVVLREDCEGLPDLMMTKRFVPLPDRVEQLYKKLVTDLLIWLESGEEVTAVNGGAKLIKLQQLLSGFVIDDRGNVAEVMPDDDHPRLDALVEEVEGTSGKVIVWCKFREDIRRVVGRLGANGSRCVEYHGRIHSQAKRQEAIDLFQTSPDVKVFVGQPAAGGEGLNLSAAEAIVWYSHTFDLIERDQANERATKVGGKSVTIVDLVSPGTVDEYVLATLESKRSVSDELAGRGLRDRLASALRSML